jgi:hypothetical protein
MKITQIMTALLLVSSLAAPAAAQERVHKHAARTHAQGMGMGMEGREVTAPPWSAACMTDHGPSECGEPMWIYGSSGERATH